jgi:hypothetical protein
MDRCGRSGRPSEPYDVCVRRDIDNPPGTTLGCTNVILERREIVTTTPPPPAPPATGIPPSAPPPRPGFDLNAFLSFRYLITPPLVQGIYVLGAIGVTITALVTMFSGAQNSVLGGLLIIVFGNLIWRVYMELVMLLFRINDGIQEIGRNTRR